MNSPFKEQKLLKLNAKNRKIACSLLCLIQPKQQLAFFRFKGSVRENIQ